MTRKPNTAFTLAEELRMREIFGKSHKRINQRVAKGEAIAEEFEGKLVLTHAEQAELEEMFDKVANRRVALRKAAEKRYEQELAKLEDPGLDGAAARIKKLMDTEGVDFATAQDRVYAHVDKDAGERIKGRGEEGENSGPS